MDLLSWVQVGITALAGLFGVALGYGRMRDRIRENHERIERLDHAIGIVMGRDGAQSMFITRRECAMSHDRLEQTIQDLRADVRAHQRSLEEVKNFARWWLTTKEGLSLAEANMVLGNGKG